MKFSSSLKAFALINALLLAGAAQAGGQTGAQFQQLDQDGDGNLSATEARTDAGLSAAWDDVDADKSGTIDRSEFSAFETMQEKAGGSDTTGEGMEQ